MALERTLVLETIRDNLDKKLEQVAEMFGTDIGNFNTFMVSNGIKKTDIERGIYPNWYSGDGIKRRDIHKLQVGKSYMFRNAGYSGIIEETKKPKRGKVIAEYPTYYLVDFGCFRECFMKKGIHAEIGGR